MAAQRSSVAPLLRATPAAPDPAPVSCPGGGNMQPADLAPCREPDRSAHRSRNWASLYAFSHASLRFGLLARGGPVAQQGGRGTRRFQSRRAGPLCAPALGRHE